MPRKPSDAIFMLIRSMSKSERRYFKIQVGQSSVNDGERFARIFDTILQQEVFNEQAIMEQEGLNGSKWAICKNRLYEHILSSLQHFHKRNGLDRKIANLLDQVEILYQKGLYQQAETLVLKAEKLAKDNSLDLVLGKAVEWKRKIAFYTKGYKKQLSESMDGARHSSQKVLSELEINSYLQQLYSRIYHIFSNEGRVARSAEARAELRILEEEVALRVNPQMLNEKRLMQLNRSLYTISLMLGEGEKCLAQACENRNIYEQSANPAALDKDNFLHAFNQAIIALHLMGRADEAALVIRELRSLPQVLPEFEGIHYQSRILDYTAFHELEGFIISQNTEAIKQCLPSLEYSLNKNLHLLNQVNVQSKKYRIALGYFTIGQYRESTQRLSISQTPNEKAFRNDIQDSMGLLFLLNHFVLENWDLLEREVPKYRQKLAVGNRLYPAQEYLLNYLEQQTKSSAPLTEMDLRIAGKLTQLESEAPKGVKTLSYFDLSNWWQSRNPAWSMAG